jgi:hypothetical protein
LAGDNLPQAPGSGEAAMPSGRTRAGFGRTRAVRDRIAAAGLNRGIAAAALAPGIAALATLWLVVPTLGPGVLSQAGGDTAEFQTVSWVLGTAHPTGYPAFVILGFIATHLLPFGDPAYRMNLLQALLAAGAVAGTVAVIQLLTGMRWIALATGLLLVIMPTYSPATVAFPIGTGFESSPVFWRLSTYADPHMFHLALVTLLFLLLLVWERRRSDAGPEGSRRADRWLVAAAAIYGVAFANHSLTLMLAPAVGLFVLAVAPWIIRQWRLVLTCVAVLVATVAVFWLELPIRAAMNAPQVYAHPDTMGVYGFTYVVLGQQFGGIPATIGADLGLKYSIVMNLISSWLGPLGFIAILGVGTSLVRRPRYVLLGVVAAAVTCAFSASYANSDLERYYLVPVFVAFTFVGLGLADAFSLCVWLVDAATGRLAPLPASAAEPAAAEPAAAEPAMAAPAAARQATDDDFGRYDAGWSRQALLAVEIVAAVVLVAASVAIVPERQRTADASPGAVSEAADTSKGIWMHAVLASPDGGGLPADAVIVSNWSDSTTLWYGQRVEGLRPDVYVVDDRTRLDYNLGEVWDVIDSYLGHRPVFLLRFPWNLDGMDHLLTLYDMRDFPLANGGTIKQVISKKGTK